MIRIALFVLAAKKKKDAEFSAILPLGRCTHQPFPFSEVATKAKGARRLPAHASRHIAPFAALGVWHIPILAARNEDVRRKGVVLGAHCFQDRLRFPNRLAKRFQSFLKPICLHNVQPNIYAEKGQFLIALRVELASAASALRQKCHNFRFALRLISTPRCRTAQNYSERTKAAQTPERNYDN
jgi:hypothetical protein